MRFVYATDLHGDEGKYLKALDLSISQKASLLHIGADILPKGYSMPKRQKDFIKKFLPRFIQRCSQNGIHFLAMLGNDDLWARKPLYRRECGPLLDETPSSIGGFTFSGYPFVPDYPFGLKTACKYDFSGWVPEPYTQTPSEFTEEGMVPISDVAQYFKDKGTIADDLRDRTALVSEIIAIHSPPVGLGLDVCIDGRRVGSKSVLQWIARTQPYMVLCGHIHENPWASGSSTVVLGRTTVVQPGQYLSAATIDPSKINTRSEDYFLHNPWARTNRLKAAVIEAVPDESPTVEILDL